MELAKVGAGGMGKVYRARDTRLGGDVAFKALPRDVAVDPERRARFRREARAVVTLVPSGTSARPCYRAALPE